MDGKTIDGRYCSNQSVPRHIQICIPRPCASWFSGEWSEVEIKLWHNIKIPSHIKDIILGYTRIFVCYQTNLLKMYITFWSAHRVAVMEQSIGKFTVKTIKHPCVYLVICAIKTIFRQQRKNVVKQDVIPLIMIWNLHTPILTI